ncbi:MAG: trypsin-like peptidase domain-containing protein [Actinomycetes bacterium]
MTNYGDASGSGTGPHFGAGQPPPQFAASQGPVPGYRAADFPAPAGVPPLGVPGATALPSPKRRGLAGMMAAASLAAVLGAGTGIGSYAYLTGQNPSATTVGVSTVPAAQSPALDGSITATAAKIQPSVVTISVSGRQGEGVGTGVVLDDQGHILTNNHVVESAVNAGTISVTFHDGQTAEAEVVGTSVSNDLAVIKVAGVANLTPAVFAKSSSLQVGQAVVAAGAPLGLAESITSGIVSNVARPVRSGDNGDAVYLAVQTDAAINPGNSGGPLVDLNAHVVGINSSIASTGGGQAGNIGIGFAIPSDVATRVSAELIADGQSTNAAMGVTVASGNDSSLPGTAGVPLQSVVPGGAADQAGLRAGDVVHRVNDFATTSADGLIAATRFYAPGTEVTVSYTRDGEQRTAQVTLGAA